MIRSALLPALIGCLVLFLVGWVALLLLPRAVTPLSFRPASFGDLAGWDEDDQHAALATFLRSCDRLAKAPPLASVKPSPMAGHVADWLGVCDRAEALQESDAISARRFFEENFSPFAILAGGDAHGLFTGYYEPIIEGSLKKDPAYPVPLYRRPPELVTVDLGLFRPNLAGRRIAGRVEGGRLMPFESRTEIEDGALKGRGLELLWLKDPADAFNLHIQGSGRIRLADGELRRVGYAGPNGHPYTSLGGLLVRRRAMAIEDVSAPAIWRWVRANPVEGARLMRENASYVFFRFLDGGARTADAPGADTGPIGAEGVALTPGRSLAVDRALLPFGAPYWLEASHPDPADPSGEPLPLARLMIGQDTGGAIKGAVRGDVFWGIGEEAEAIAGHMANPGRIYILLPRRAEQQNPSGSRAHASEKQE